MFKLCNRMWEQEEYPQALKKTTLNIIYKGKGRQEDLSSNRSLHCKQWWPKVAKSLVVEDGLNWPLKKGFSGARSKELMFVLKSLVARLRKQSKMVIIQSFEISNV